jgi:hypothetical protein
MTRTEAINWLGSQRGYLCEEDRRAVDSIIAALWGSDQPLSDAKRVAAETSFRDPMAGGGIRSMVRLVGE